MRKTDLEVVFDSDDNIPVTIVYKIDNHGLKQIVRNLFGRPDKFDLVLTLFLFMIFILSVIAYHLQQLSLMEIHYPEFYLVSRFMVLLIGIYIYLFCWIDFSWSC